MYDITNRKSLDQLKIWKSSFLEKSMVVQPDTFPFMVIGNKADLDGQRTVSADAAKKVVSELGDGIEHIETSAKDNTNVTQAFSRLAS